MKIFTLFVLVLCLGISNGFGKVYPSLKVKGDFRKIELLIEDVNPNKLVTTEDITNTVKLRLFANNIKTLKTYGSEFLYVTVIVMDLEDDVNFVYKVNIELRKNSTDYGVNQIVAGFSFTPNQGSYGSLGICSKEDSLLSGLKSAIDMFLLDYLESNMAD